MGGFRIVGRSFDAADPSARDGDERVVGKRASGVFARISRREAVTGGVAVAAMLALGGAGVAFAGERRLLRPPGGQDEGRLWGACIKCDRCRSACPHGAIDVAHLEDGIVNARTPKMNFRKGFCDFCLPDGALVTEEGGEAARSDPLCVRACPTGALVFGFDCLSGGDKIGVARVDVSECLLYRSGSGRCSKQCVEACAFGALSLGEDGRLMVDEERCNGCGACEWSCPSSSYASYTGSGRRGINVEARGGESS